MIVLGFALAVIALYMIPFDQLAHAGPRADFLKLRLQAIIDRLNGLGLTSQADQSHDSSDPCIQLTCVTRTVSTFFYSLVRPFHFL